MEPAEEKRSGKVIASGSEPLLDILIVEDNLGDVVIVKELLRESGIDFKLTHASNLKETFAFCGEKEFDVILLDLGLQESTSLDTLKMIKVFKIKSPIVVMTGLDDEDIALSALREGAQDYLVKNRLTSEIVLRSIKYSIERKKIQELLRKHTRQFSILSSATAALSRCEIHEACFKITCDNITFLLENANAISIELGNNVSLRISCTEWLVPWYDTIKVLTGIDMANPELHINRSRKELIDLFSDGKLHEVKGGLHEILDNSLDKAKYEELERKIGINKIYAFGFIKAKFFHGAGLIFSPKIIGDDDLNIIETIISQATLSIHRRVIEKDLRLSEYRFRKLTKELEGKVVQRTHDLETANQQLQQELSERIKAEEALKMSELQLRELNATKDKFFSIVAHDLKNPFTSLIGSSELLYDNINQMDNESIHKLALILNDSAKSGYAILQNLLDWSRSQTGLLKYNPEKINLSELIDENISNVQLFASNKEIDLVHEPIIKIYIVSDKCMINTILRNLLSNAIKFTQRGGKVVINAKTNQNEVIISVKDTGIGISGENIEKLFKLDTKYTMKGTENEQGTGLGLKLCKEFVEKEGGKIWVESSINNGSVFSFSIPMNKSGFAKEK